MRTIHLFYLIIALLLSTLVAGCNNLFSSSDKPSGNAQLLSAARAAFDKGNYDEARDLYQQLTDDEGDVKKSESAFLIMTQQGVSMTTLVEFVGNKANGQALTQLAEHLTSGSGEARRLALYEAYTQHKTITDTNLKGFVQFTTTLALFAEVLAEAASADGTLRKTDLVKNANCSTAHIETSDCDLAPTSRMTNDVSYDIKTHSPTGTQPTVDEIYYLLRSVIESLALLSPNGDFGSTYTKFTTILDTVGILKPSTDPLIARALLGQLIARNGFDIGE